MTKVSDNNWLSEKSDHELVEAYEQVADPMVVEQIKAEERRRNSERALEQATKSNKIAIASLIVAILSLCVAVFAILKGG